MGHARDCWCDSHEQARLAKELAYKAATVKGPSADTALPHNVNYSSPKHSPSDMSLAALYSRDKAPGDGTIPVGNMDKSRSKECALSEALGALSATLKRYRPETNPVDCMGRSRAWGSLVAPIVRSKDSPPAERPAAYMGTHIETAVAGSMSNSRASSLDAALNGRQAPCTVSDSGDDLDSDFSDSDAVIVTPSSEVTNFGFKKLEVIDGVPVDSDDDWSAVSPGLRAHQPGSLSSSRTVSDASVQTSSTPLIVSSHPVALPSPPQTPSSSAYQAPVSDAGSETE